MRALREKVTSEADYVGDKFAEEARKIHYKEADQRGIYGEATREEVAGLVEDGIDFMPLPERPRRAQLALSPPDVSAELPQSRRHWRSFIT